MVKPPFKHNVKKIKRKKIIEDLSYRLKKNSYIVIDSEIIDGEEFVYGFFIINWKYSMPTLYSLNTLNNYLVHGKKIFIHKVEQSEVFNKQVIKVTFKNN